MGSLTRRMRKHAPVEAYAVKRLPATPARAQVFIAGQRVESLDPMPIVVAGPGGGELTYTISDRIGPIGCGDPIAAPACPEPDLKLQVGPATLSKAETFQPGPPSQVFRAPDPAPRRRPNALQLIALAAMLGAGLPPRGDR